MGGPEGLNNNFLSTVKWSSEDLWEKKVWKKLECECDLFTQDIMDVKWALKRLYLFRFEFDIV